MEMHKLMKLVMYMINQDLICQLGGFRKFQCLKKMLGTFENTKDKRKEEEG